MSNPQQVYLIPFVTLLIMLGPFSVDTYLPAFPAMESVYSISTADMSQTLGAFLFAFALPTLAWAPLIDRFGRKSTVVISLLMPGIGILVLDCYPKNRGVASALQGFAYMGSNALVASVLIPVVLGQLLWFTFAQAVLLKNKVANTRYF